MEKMPMTSISSGVGMAVLPDVYCFCVQIANVIFLGNPIESNEFCLVDAGMPESHEMIIEDAKKRFGEDCRLKSIILTHGHFDHVGALEGLTKKWDVPVYAHSLEEPYLTGKSDYPPPNPEVDGLIAKLSPMFPRHSIDISSRLEVLPADGSIPSLEGWRYIHTPGHTPGHISLFRELDRVLIAGDAFVTVEQESLYRVMTQKQEISGPPAYFTSDWLAASASVKTLAALKPKIAVTGHGLPMVDESLEENLEKLARDFDQTEIPKNKK